MNAPRLARDRADLLLSQLGVHPRARPDRRARSHAGRDPALAAPLSPDPRDHPEAPSALVALIAAMLNAFHRLFGSNEKETPECA